MGNAHQLTAAPQERRNPWHRTVLYGAGMASMLLISMASSLTLWIAIPWAFLGWSPTLVTSGSMQPLITAGDVVLVRPVAADDLTVNSVVLYDRPDTGRVLHRIVEQLPDGSFLTRGDANTSDDSGFLHADQVEGAAVLAVPWIGRPSLWLAEGRTTLLTAVGLGLVAVLALTPRAFDPAFDPWASGKRVKPAEVLLGRVGGDRRQRRSSPGRQLMPEGLHDLVLQRLAAQSTAVGERTASLVRGLS